MEATIFINPRTPTSHFIRTIHLLFTLPRAFTVQKYQPLSMDKGVTEFNLYKKVLQSKKNINRTDQG